jgi:hypothetical protein
MVSFFKSHLSLKESGMIQGILGDGRREKLNDIRLSGLYNSFCKIRGMTLQKIEDFLGLFRFLGLALSAGEEFDEDESERRGFSGVIIVIVLSIVVLSAIVIALILTSTTGGIVNTTTLTPTDKE